MTNIILRAENIHKKYGKLEVLKGISFQVNQGETTVIIGPSGTGKSTLLTCINQLTPPDQGHIWLENTEITNPDTDINIIRLFQWGEAYMTSISSAKRLLDALKNTGVIDNIDNQLRENSGPELKLNFNHFYRKWVKTNEGDILKTEPLDEYFFDSIE